MQPRQLQAYLPYPIEKENPLKLMIHQIVSEINWYMCHLEYNHLDESSEVATEIHQLVLNKLIACKNHEEDQALKSQLRELQAKSSIPTGSDFSGCGRFKFHYIQNNKPYVFALGVVPLVAFYEMFPEGILLAKYTLADRIRQQVTQLNSAIIYEDFPTEISKVEATLTEEVYSMMSTVRPMNMNTSASPKETRGAGLLRQIAGDLAKLREMHQNMILPPTIEEAKRLFLTNIDIATTNYKDYLANKKPSIFGVAPIGKMNFVRDIKVIIDRVGVDGEISLDDINAIRELVNEPTKKKYMYSHTLGTWATFNPSTGEFDKYPESNKYMDIMIAQLNILDRRIKALGAPVVALNNINNY